MNDFLVPNLKRFVQTHTLKCSTESFLLRLRQKFSSGLRLTNQATTSASSSNQSLVSSQAANINGSEDDLLLMEEWTKWYQARRLEWKQTVHDRKHKYVLLQGLQGIFSWLGYKTALLWDHWR